MSDTPPHQRPRFASALAQSPRSDVLEWRLPRPFAHCVLTGRSRAAWHTSFVVPQLDLLLDAGLCVNRLRPRHVFLTHGHSDHTLLAPAFVGGGGGGGDGDDGLPHVYCPVEMAGLFDDFVRASVLLDAGGGGPDEEPRDDDDDGGVGVDDDKDGQEDGRQDSTAQEQGTDAPNTTENTTHITHALRPGDTVPLHHLRSRANTLVTATAFACTHSVPSLGYLFSRVTQRLRPALAALAGPRLQALRAAGEWLTEPHAVPFLAFLGDSTADTLAAEPEWLRAGVPVVVTECSFLYPRHKALADRTKHTAWGDLVHVVRRWPQTTFVLTHFSLRYSEADIVAFFTDMVDCPANIVVWADPLA
ncbi:hypothetical protein HRG_000815 [Hirsutella rhossiliensis]|uniref:3'-tRNA processing endoribonuclease n=1 Tax=Hirsutella rhossiliensis TaxID=111463 RepID=A0A9P8N5T7_9HYPO|nr:3'-tRNA processing endoribonuclease [Hirsutella rhossiliensis]KAH0968173.1 3'-tRNA processing endoribonuclease [Hirsutella rhossiliensis]